MQQHKEESIDAGHRGGAVRSSVELFVMNRERRDCVVQAFFSLDNQEWEDRDEKGKTV